MIAAALILAAGVAIVAAQRSFIYPAGRAAPAPAVGATPGYRDVSLRTADGLTLRGLYRAAAPGHSTLIFFHGNADGLTGSARAMRRAADAGYGVLVPEYRGYAGQAGRPSEAGLYSDARAALHWLGVHGVGRHDTIIVGNSLGAGVATQLATECADCAALVVVSGFTSLPNLIAERVGIDAIRWLVFDTFDNLAKIARVAMPVLILHGAADTVVPVSHGLALARAAGVHGHFGEFADAGHDLVYRDEAAVAMLVWPEL